MKSMYAKWVLVLALLGGVSLAGWQLTQATLSTTAPRNDYIGNGATATYDYTFRIFAASDLRVTTQTSAGVITPLVLTTGYTVTGVNNPNGGTITLVAGNLASGTTLTIRSDRTPQQSTDLRNQGTFRASTHENKFDELTRYAQQLTDVVGRSIKFPETDNPASVSPTLPSSIERASKFLAFDGSGNPIASGGGLTSPPVTAFATTLLDDANAATARTTLGAVNIAGDTMTGNLRISTSGAPELRLNTTSGSDQRTALRLYKSDVLQWIVGTDYGIANAHDFFIYDSVGIAKRLAIDANGVVELGAGQLKFPASQNASTDVNTLDDYEEGTCTLGVGGTATYTSRDCYYIKIGRQVTLSATVIINTIGTGSTSRITSGVPFAHMTTTTTVGAACSVGFFATLSNNKVSIQPRMISASSEIHFYSLAAAGASNSEAAILGNGTNINFTCVYFTD
jgi:hypothetical protein